MKKVVLGIILIILTHFSYTAISKLCDNRAVNTFANTTDGYCFDMSDGFAPDSSFYPISVHFHSADTTVEIYAQECTSIPDMVDYMSYTSSAITGNNVDFQTVANRALYRGIHCLTWSRKSLSRVPGDKNHYMKLDIPRKGKVYTMLIKSIHPLLRPVEYLSRISFIDTSTPPPVMPKLKARNADFNAETTAFYEKTFAKDASVSWGIFDPQYMEDSLKDFEEYTEHTFEVFQWYTSLYQKYNPKKVTDVLKKAYSEGRTVSLTLQPSWIHEEGNDFFRLLDGYYDDFLNAYASDVAEFGHPVMMRFGNEMNGKWCEYSGYNMSLDSALYREAYRYVFDIFRKNGADNVIWVFNPNGISYPDHKWNREEMYYPGSEYVDVLGLTLYNTGTFYDAEKWTAFKDLYTPLYERSMKTYDMPFAITEFACAREGGDKENWTRDMLKSLDGFENIKMAIWWNSCNYNSSGVISRAYFIDDSDEMKDIFKEYFAERSR